jgi:hypothetical protein
MMSVATNNPTDKTTKRRKVSMKDNRPTKIKRGEDSRKVKENENENENENLGEDQGKNQGKNLGEDLGEDQGEDLGEDLGEDQGEDQGEDSDLMSNTTQYFFCLINNEFQ